MNYVMEKLQVENVVALFVNESESRWELSKLIDGIKRKELARLASDFLVACVLDKRDDIVQIMEEIRKLDDEEEFAFVFGSIAGGIHALAQQTEYTNYSEAELRRVAESAIDQVYHEENTSNS